MRLHIELLGLPGAGKSTLLAPLVGCLDAAFGRTYDLTEATRRSVLRGMHSGVGVRPLIRQFVYRIMARPLASIFPYTSEEIAAYGRFCVLHPELVAIANRALFEVFTMARDREMLLRCMFRECSSFQLMSEHLNHGESVVLEEGFAHRAIGLFARREQLEPERVDEYVRAIPRPGAVFVVHASVEECHRRLRRRDLPYILDGLSVAQQTAKLHLLAECQEIIQATLVTERVPVFYINNTGTIADAVAQIEIMTARLGSVFPADVEGPNHGRATLPIVQTQAARPAHVAESRQTESPARVSE